MELLSGEVPAEPGTNSNQTQVQQNQNITHPNKERILNFQIPFFLFYILLGLAGWVVTVFIFKTKHSEDSYVSPWCPELPKYGTDPRRNLYRCNFLFDLHAFVSENETSFAQESELVWRKSKLTYGDLRCAFRFSTNLSISEVSSMSPLVLFFDKWNPLGRSSLESKTKPNFPFPAHPKRGQPLPAGLCDPKRPPSSR